MRRRTFHKTYFLATNDPKTVVKKYKEISWILLDDTELLNGSQFKMLYPAPFANRVLNGHFSSTNLNFLLSHFAPQKHFGNSHKKIQPQRGWNDEENAIWPWHGLQSIIDKYAAAEGPSDQPTQKQRFLPSWDLLINFDMNFMGIGFLHPNSLWNLLTFGLILHFTTW